MRTNFRSSTTITSTIASSTVVVVAIIVVAIVVARGIVVVVADADARPTHAPRRNVATYEAEDGRRDPSSIVDATHGTWASGGHYVDMGGLGSYIEFAIRADLSSPSSTSSVSSSGTYDCAISFQYSSGSSDKMPRRCALGLNGTVIASLNFPTTGSWGVWTDEVVPMVVDCRPGTVIRLEALTRWGGPNVDVMTLTYLVNDDGGGGKGKGKGGGEKEEEGERGDTRDQSDGGKVVGKEAVSADRTTIAAAEEEGIATTDDDAASAGKNDPALASSSSSSSDGIVVSTSSDGGSIAPPSPPSSPRPTPSAGDDDNGRGCHDDDGRGCSDGDEDDDGPLQRYVKFPDGIVTYGMDDGGCYYCGTRGDDRGDRGGGDDVAVRHPSRRSDLVDACRKVCDDDRGCVAFTVGREPTRAGQEYMYDGVVANCCLERRMYPSGVYVDGSSSGGNDDDYYGRRRKKDHCQLEAACWTRYERRGARRLARDENSGAVAGPPPPGRTRRSSSSSSSISCVRTWDPVSYTDDEIRDKVGVVTGGCANEYDAISAGMLALSHAQCVAETYAESMTVSIVVRPSGSSTYVRVFPDGAGGSGRFVSSLLAR